jgi:hypothetical protein
MRERADRSRHHPERANIMSDNTTCNGWANYATWRVNMEICDDVTSNLGTEIEENGLEPFDSIGDLADYLRDNAEEVVSGYGDVNTDSIAYDYASAFLSQVNWDEIARSAISDDPSVIREG